MGVRDVSGDARSAVVIGLVEKGRFSVLFLMTVN